MSVKRLWSSITGKHHNAYVVNTNKLIEGTELAKERIEDFVQKTAGDASRIGIFHNAAQVWNHTFYWQCIKPNGGGPPYGLIAEKINAEFGSYETVSCQEFKNCRCHAVRQWVGMVRFGR